LHHCSDCPAFADLVQGESGIAALMAQVNGQPHFYPTVIIDTLSGYVLASSLGTALYARERTGKCQRVQLPMSVRSATPPRKSPI
jgi:crotonobetainyl-CoA:carnitine CoA-transferase CaiB-like acyl-CoA transferase